MDAVAKLPEPYRNVLLLHLGEELSGKEIAARGTLSGSGPRSAAHARVLIQRGLKRLRQLLSDGTSLLVPTGLAITLGSRRATADSLGPLKRRVVSTYTGAAPVASTFSLAMGTLMNKFVLGSIGAAALVAVTFHQVNRADHTTSVATLDPVMVPPVGPRPGDVGTLETETLAAVESRELGETPARSKPSAVDEGSGVEPPSVGPEGQAGQTSRALLELMGRSLDSNPPPLQEVDALISRLGSETVILEETLIYHDDGGLKSAKVELPGTKISGTVSVDGAWPRVEFSVPSQGGDGFFAAHFAISLYLPSEGESPAVGAGRAAGGFVSFQHHPDTSGGPTAFAGPVTCGWSYRVDGKRTVIDEISADYEDDGKSWAIGNLDGGQTELLEGASYLAPFDAWATKLGPILRR